MMKCSCRVKCTWGMEQMCNDLGMGWDWVEDVCFPFFIALSRCVRFLNVRLNFNFFLLHYFGKFFESIR